MYHIHTTPAFAVNVLPSGEKHQFITLFTREFGMIRARVQSVRVPLSKLRYALQEYSYAHVSLVKGKDSWRVVNAQPLHNMYFELKHRQEIFLPVARILSLLKRLLPEEGCESQVFDDFHRLCDSILKYSYDGKQTVVLEWLFLLRSLYFLGYIKADNLLILCSGPANFIPEYLDSITSHREAAVGAINGALKASQL